MSKNSVYFVFAIFAALASLASFVAGFLIGDSLQIVLAIVGVVAIAAAGGLFAVGMRSGRDA